MPMDKDSHPFRKTAKPKVSELKITMRIVRAKSDNLKA